VAWQRRSCGKVATEAAVPSSFGDGKSCPKILSQSQNRLAVSSKGLNLLNKSFLAATEYGTVTGWYRPQFNRT
jgi:hypothetical protein